MELYHPVHDGDVPTFDLEDEDLPSLHWVVLVVGEEQQVTSEESRLHATTGMQKRPSHMPVQSGYYPNLGVYSHIQNLTPKGGEAAPQSVSYHFQHRIQLLAFSGILLK